MAHLSKTPLNINSIAAVCDSLGKTSLASLVGYYWATDRLQVNSSPVKGKLIIFPLFLFEKIAILPMTARAGCAIAFRPWPCASETKWLTLIQWARIWNRLSSVLPSVRTFFLSEPSPILTILDISDHRSFSCFFYLWFWPHPRKDLPKLSSIEFWIFISEKNKTKFDINIKLEAGHFRLSSDGSNISGPPCTKSL